MMRPSHSAFWEFRFEGRQGSPPVHDGASSNRHFPKAVRPLPLYVDLGRSVVLFDPGEGGKARGGGARQALDGRYAARLSVE